MFQDYFKMLNEFPMLYDNYTIPFPDWNHIDFMFAIDTDVYFHPRILENMEAAEKLGKSSDTRERIAVMENVLEKLVRNENVEEEF